MPEFLQLVSPSIALKTLLDTLPGRKTLIENVNPENSQGRVLVEDIHAAHPLPEFARSTVDGFAVRASDTYGASESQPGYLRMIGEVIMGDEANLQLMPGTCAMIHTGGMLPECADAVVMLEHAQVISHEKRPVDKDGKQSKLANEVEIYRSVTEGENVLEVGEDVGKGDVILPSGRCMRPVDIGVCKAFGIPQIRIAAKPCLGIISTGDEVIPPTQKPKSGQVRDINTYTLSALIMKCGGEPISYGIVSDNLEDLIITGRKALDECDAVVITAGSSASARDITAQAINSLGAPGVLVHGVDIRPGKPTILAVCNEKAVIGLPGNPVSALVIARLFITPLIHKLLGMSPRQLEFSVRASLMINIPSQAGREEWVAVKLNEKITSNNNDNSVLYEAVPVFGKSNLIVSLSRADGYIHIPPERTGISAGEIVDVFDLSS